MNTPKETNFIPKNFKDLITKLRECSSQDLMLINETSPSVVRYLSSDNRFRNYKVIDTNSVVSIEMMRNDTDVKHLNSFKDFIKDLCED